MSWKIEVEEERKNIRTKTGENYYEPMSFRYLIVVVSKNHKITAMVVP